MVRQLEEELRMRMRGPSVEMQQQMEVLYNENEHLTREIAILRDTIRVSLSLFPSFASRMEKKEETKEGRETSGSAIFPTRIFCIPPTKGERYQSFSLQLPRLSRRDVIKKKKRNEIYRIYF